MHVPPYISAVTSYPDVLSLLIGDLLSFSITDSISLSSLPRSGLIKTGELSWANLDLLLRMLDTSPTSLNLMRISLGLVSELLYFPSLVES